MPNGTCTVEGCSRYGNVRRGYCALHYQRWQKYGVPDHPYETLESRFWKKVDRRGDAECWPWTASVKRAGYGQIGSGGRGGRNLTASRVSWELHYGVIPDGLSVCHTCDNPLCVNPAHLWLGTYEENMEDMRAKGRSPGRKSKQPVQP